MPADTTGPDPDTSDPDRGGGVQSVHRALQILELVADAGTAGVTDLAAELGVHKSTVSRILTSLEARGFVEQLASRKYRIGLTVVRLAGSTTPTLSLAQHGQDVCDTLAAEVGEATNIAVLGGTQAINVVEAQGSSSVALRTWVGQASPAHATSSGKVLLAGLPTSDVRSLYPDALPRYTDNTLTDIDDVLDELRTVADRGWALADEELEVGLVAVAAPIRDHSGAVVSSLSVSGPRYRLEPDDAPALARRVRAAADTVSARFGYRD